MWYLFALSSAVIASVRRANDKQLSHSLHNVTLGWSIQLLSLPVQISALLLFGEWLNPFTLGLQFWLPMLFLVFAFYPLNNYFFFRAMKEGELSKILPLQSLSPFFALVLGYIVLGQRPSIMAIPGIVSIMVGVYMLNLKGKYLHNPLKIFTADKPNLYMLASILLVSLVGVFDTFALKVCEPIYFSLLSTVGALGLFSVMALRMRIYEVAVARQEIKRLSFSGTFSALTTMTYLAAISDGPIAYVSAIKGSSILMGSLIGIIYFKESFTKIKAVALCIISIGAVILALAQ